MTLQYYQKFASQWQLAFAVMKFGESSPLVKPLPKHIKEFVEHRASKATGIQAFSTFSHQGEVGKQKEQVWNNTPPKIWGVFRLKPTMQAT